MIEFDYEIERDEGDEIRTYFPDKYTSPLESTTTYIEGPNSSGKSTLLHLIALGFYGLEDEDLARPLREDIDDLLQNDKILFNVKIKDSDGNPILETKKTNKENAEIETYHRIKGKMENIDSEVFKKNYKLIYDIPDNPTERIEKIADEIKYYQTDIANNVSNYSSIFRDILTDITEGRDPDRIEKLQIGIDGQKSNLVIQKNQLITDKRDFEVMCRYAYPYLLQHYTEKLSGIKSEITKIKNSASSKLKAKNSSEKEYNEILDKIQKTIRKAQREYHEANTYLKTLSRESKMNGVIGSEWNEIDFVKIRTEYEIPGNFTDGVENILKICNEIYEENKLGEVNAKVYSQIINTLKEANLNQVKMPEMGITLDDFINKIENLKNSTNTQAIIAKNSKDATTHLNNMLIYLNSLRLNFFPELNRISDKLDIGSETGVNDSEITRMQQGLNLKARKIKEKIEHYRHKCAKNNVSEFEHTKIIRESRDKVEKYLSYTEAQLSEELEYFEEEVKKSEKQCELLKLRIERDEVEIDRLKNKKPHEYENKKNTIEEIMNYLGSLERKFLNTFSKTLESYKKKRALPNKATVPNEYKYTKEYYEGVSNYLGAKLGTIRHIEGEYNVEKVNLVSGNITTTSGKKIRLRSMGTGQTQSTYLQAKLKTNYGGRKLIVMFDEVGMMDEASMAPVKNLIKDLKKKGDLLVGLVVQRLDTAVKITPI